MKKIKKLSYPFVLGSDWLNNLVYLANSTAYKLTPRFKTALKMWDLIRHNFKIGRSAASMAALRAGASTNKSRSRYVITLPRRSFF